MGYKLTDLASLEDGSTLPVGSKEIEVNIGSSVTADKLMLKQIYFPLLFLLIPSYSIIILYCDQCRLLPP